MSIQTKIIDTLRSAGLRVWLPAQHEGRCTEPYYVVTDAGRRPVSRNNAERVVLVTAYVPASVPLALDEALTRVREALLRMKSVKLGGSSEAALDDAAEALYATIELTALCSAV